MPHMVKGVKRKGWPVVAVIESENWGKWNLQVQTMAKPPWLNVKLSKIGRCPDKANYTFGYDGTRLGLNRHTAALEKCRPDLLAEVMVTLDNQKSRRGLSRRRQALRRYQVSSETPFARLWCLKSPNSRRCERHLPSIFTGNTK